MPKILLAVALVFFSLWVLALGVQAETPGVGFEPVPVFTGAGEIASPEVDIEAGGQPLLAWLYRPAGEEQASFLYVASPPRGEPVSLVSFPHPPSDVRLALSPLAEKGSVLGLTFPLTQTLLLQRITLPAETSPQSWTLPLGTVFAFDKAGEAHFAWVESGEAGQAIHYLSGAEETILPIDPFLIVEGLSLALDARGEGYLAWAVHGRLGEEGGIYLTSPGKAELSMVVAGGFSPQLRVGPLGHLHLCWRAGNGLYYANSQDWRRVTQVVEGLEPQSPWAFQVGPEGVAHLVWVQEGKLWHALSLDWQRSREELLPSCHAAQLALAVDPRGRPHVAWTTTREQGENALYYLLAARISPQFVVSYPLGGEVLARQVTLRAETNLPPEEIQRVEFYLEVEDWRGELEGLIFAGIDRDGTDGWGVALSPQRLDPACRYRVVAFAMVRNGRTLQARGAWFHLGGKPCLWVQNRVPSSVKGFLAPLALLSSGQSFNGELGLYLLPRCATGGGESPCPDPADWRFVGAKRLVLRPEGRPYTQLALPIEWQSLPDGRYRALVVAKARSGVKYFTEPSSAFSFERVPAPRVRVLKPRRGDVVQGRLQVAAQVEEIGGTIQRVDFYLERSYALWEEVGRAITVPQQIWLGSDTEGSDGWGLRVLPMDGWQGDGWRVRVVAVDDQGLSGTALSAPFSILGRYSPVLRLIRPSSSRILRGVEQVVLSVARGLQYLEGAYLYVEGPTGELSPLGEMRPSMGRWVYEWDTRPFPDGPYTLLVVATNIEGEKLLLRSARLRVDNHRVLGAFKTPTRGAQVKGIIPLELRYMPGQVGIREVSFYYRDGAGELHFIGRDAQGEDGWGVFWNSALALDGDYELVASIEDVRGCLSYCEVPVSVRNMSPAFTFAWPGGEDPWRGLVELSWEVGLRENVSATVSIEYSPDDGEHWLEVARDIQGNSFLWDTRDFPDSSRARLRFIVAAGGHYSQAVSPAFVVDNVNDPPVVRLLAPRPGETYGRKLRIAWQAWDADQEKLSIRLEYRREGEGWLLLRRGVEGETSYLWDTKGVPPGSYELRIIVRDPRGGEAVDTVRGVKIVDNSPPTVRLLLPDGQAQLEQEAVILWEASDPDKDELSIDLYYSDNAGQAWLPLAEGLPNNGFFMWQVSYLPEGDQYRVRVVARDAYFTAVDESRQTFSIGRGSQPIVLLLSPRGGEEVSGIRLIRWAAFHMAGENIQARVSLRPWGQVAWKPLAELKDQDFYLWDTREYPNGRYELRVSVSDGSKSAEAMTLQPVWVLNVPDRAPWVRLLSPRGGEEWAGCHQVLWEAGDPDGDVLTATLSLSLDEGKHWQELAQVNAYTGCYLWDTRTVASSRHCLLRVLVSDGENEAEDVTSRPWAIINRQDGPPYVALLSPGEGEEALRGRQVSWLAEAQQGSPLELTLSLYDGEEGFWRRELTTAAGVGRYTFERAWALDHPYRLGLLADDGDWASLALSPVFTKEVLASQRISLSFQGPGEGEVWSGIKTIRWQAQDPMGRASVRVAWSNDGGLTWRELASGLAEEGEYPWDTRRVPNGRYLLRATASNGRVEVSRTSAPFIVENPGNGRPFISLLSPRGGEIWSGVRELVWQAQDPDGDPLEIVFAYSLDGGQNWQTLGRAFGTGGRFVWDTTTIPNCERVWVRALASDGHFSCQAVVGPLAIRNLHAPFIRVRVAGRSTQWPGAWLISWVAVSEDTFPLQVRLEASFDGGKSWQVLAEGLPAQGRYVWSEPGAFVRGGVLLRAWASEGLQSALDALEEPLQLEKGLFPQLPFFFR